MVPLVPKRDRMVRQLVLGIHICCAASVYQEEPGVGRGWFVGRGWPSPPLPQPWGGGGGEPQSHLEQGIGEGGGSRGGGVEGLELGLELYAFCEGHSRVTSHAAN